LPRHELLIDNVMEQVLSTSSPLPPLPPAIASGTPRNCVWQAADGVVFSPQLNHISYCEWQAIVIFLFFFFGQLTLSSIMPKVRGIAIPWAVIMAAIGMICGNLRWVCFG
jgi:hypothetical protein